MVPNTQQTETYEDKTSGSLRTMKVRMKIGAMGVGLEFFISHTYDAKLSVMTWTLDYGRKSDVIDSVGYWGVEPHPTKPGQARVFYSVDVAMPDWLPGFVVGILNSKALSDATGWVKTESEKKQKALGPVGGAAAPTNKKQCKQQEGQLEQRQVRAAAGAGGARAGGAEYGQPARRGVRRRDARRRHRDGEMRRCVVQRAAPSLNIFLRLSIRVLGAHQDAVLERVPAEGDGKRRVHRQHLERAAAAVGEHHRDGAGVEGAEDERGHDAGGREGQALAVDEPASEREREQGDTMMTRELLHARRRVEARVFAAQLEEAEAELEEEMREENVLYGAPRGSRVGARPISDPPFGGRAPSGYRQEPC